MRLIDADSLKKKLTNTTRLAFVLEMIDNEPEVKLGKILQYAVDAQIEINRAVFALNSLLFWEVEE